VSNDFFDWRSKPFQERFIRFATVRSEEVNAAFDEVSQGFDLALQAMQQGVSNPAETTTTLVDGAEIEWDMAAGQMAFLTLDTQRLTRALLNPLNTKKGKYTLFVTQNAAGNQNITSWGSAYVLVEDVTINPAANSVTILQVFSDGLKFYVCKHGGGSAAPAPAPTPAPTPAPSPAPSGPPITAAFAAGTNLSGMEWAQPGIRYGNSTAPNMNYTVPRAATIAYLASQGITVVRLPLSWELLQPLRASSPANAAVVAGYNTTLGNYTKGGLWEPYAQYVDKVLDACQAAGIKCLIDIHNYCRYKDFKYQPDGSVLGFVDPSDPLLPPYTSDSSQVVQTIMAKVNPTLTVADFTDLWTKIATRWKAHAALGGYGLMNEPNQMPAVGKNFSIDNYPNPADPTNDYVQDYSIWATYAQAAVTAIRVLDGTKPIYVSGNGWSSCINYTQLNPNFPLTGNNLVYEFHLYLDATSGGFRFDWDDEAGKHFSAGEGNVDISTNTGVNRLSPILAWAAANGNPPLACGEFGIPVENKPDGTLDTRWLTAAAATINQMKLNNIEVYTWMGGDHWPIHAYPINHAPKLYQSKTVNPIAGAYLLGAKGTNLATIFDEGGQWSAGGAAVTIKVQARGNLTAPVNLTVASNAGGSFSKTALTLAAGVNSEDSFTFTPVGNTISTLTYTRTGGGQVPPARKVYSLTNPVAYASTSLADAAKAIMAKYNAGCWLAQDALKEYQTPAAAAAGDYIRGISNSGSGGTIESPMEMLNWLNQDAGSLRGAEGPCIFNNDPAGFAAADFTTYGRRGLLCKKQEPVVGATGSDPSYRFPAVAQAFGLKNPHFLMSAFKLTNPAVDGVLAAAQHIMAPTRSALKIQGGMLMVEMCDQQGHLYNVTYGTVPANTLTVGTLKYDGATMTARLNSENGSSSGAATLVASPFSTLSLGQGYWDYYPQQAIQGYQYGWIIGPALPTDAELGVLENYLKSFGQAAVAPPAGWEALLQTQFDAPNNNGGVWLSARSLSEFAKSPTDATAPAAFTDFFRVWHNHGNVAGGHELSQADATTPWQLGTDANGKHYGNCYTGAPLKNVGGATSKFYFALAIDVRESTYDGTILSDSNAANVGWKVEHLASAPHKFKLTVGTGAASVSVTVAYTVPVGNTDAAGLHLLEGWHDGTNIQIQLDGVDPGAAGKAACGAISPGAADMVLLGGYPFATYWSSGVNGNVYEGAVLKNYCPSSTDRATLRTGIAAQAALVV
jgi:aryl-phospho-beta-D-glucosidase BglC (GH1 family)